MRKSLLPVALFFLHSQFSILNSPAQPPEAREGGTALGWQPENFGAFVPALCADLRGNIWVGTEDKGVWRYEPRARSWKQWTSKDGLGDDDVYALACDQQGRVWAGHLNHGVSVWNGAQWKNYDVLHGPLGERVFDIAVNPKDGDVWIATNAGLARYTTGDKWLYYHRGNGLPADQMSALAFAENGTIYAGTQCDGLAIASPADDYQTWRSVVSPYPKMPHAAAGRGLPGNVINDVIVAPDGTVWVATKNGLARSGDGGKSWTFLRGDDWQARVEGLYDNPEKLAADVDATPLPYDGALLAEDEVMSLASDAAGRLWIGYLRKGCEVRDIKTNRRLLASGDGPNGAPDDDIRAILPLPAAQPAAIFARYGGLIGGLGSSGKIAPAAVGDTMGVVPLPSPAAPPSVAEMKAIAQQLRGEPALADGTGAYLGADWRTQGDWVGRYGQQLTGICGVEFASNFSGTNDAYNADFTTGPHFKKSADVFTYVHDRESDNRNVLFVPFAGVRRPGELNDGTWQGQLYPYTFEGPDLWVKVQVPAGPQRVALHFLNVDGHSGANRYRDYLVELKLHNDNRNKADAAPALASARVRDFWGAVYQNFLVQGPGTFDFKIARQGSFCTKLIGLFINRMDAAPGYKEFAPPQPEARDETDPNVAAAVALWRAASPSAEWNYPARLLAYRALAATKHYPDTLANWRWRLPLWTADDREDFDDFTVRTAQSVKTKKAPK